jgi:PilZ domain
MHMKKLIRRRAPRYLIRIPLRFRPLASPEMPYQIAESLNLSARGVSFATRFPLDVGTPVQLYLKVPEEVTGKPSSEWRCRGQVIHARPVESDPGTQLVGVLIVYYEIVTAAERRAS